MNCLRFFKVQNKLKSYENVCKNKDICGIVMSSEKDNILDFNHYLKSDKISYIIYADIKSLLKKTDECANKLENTSTTKIGEHIW